jgi:predicted metal-dependent HD superfamily phosphohydrolase
MGVESDLLSKAQAFVEEFFKKNLSENIFYHNIDHTLDVVEAAEKIGRFCDLTEEDMETVLLAAWFHDTGYYEGQLDHEIKRKEIAENFLRNNHVSEKRIAEVCGCIIATKIPQRPVNNLEEVLCDADLYHLATNEFFKKSELLKKEISMAVDNKVEDEEWYKNSIKFLKKHHYFTQYGKEKLFPVKQKNLKKLKALNKELRAIKEAENDNGDVSNPSGQADSEQLVFGKKKPVRGIETLFRVTSRNHVDFSSMADNKANIMITINTLMMSIVFSLLIQKLQEYPALIFPTIILTIVCTVTIIFAILSTRPNLSRGTFSRDEIKKKQTNLLFFGNFYKMPLKDYEWGVRQIMKDSDYLYGSLIRDVYYLGKVLGKKYFFLRISYTVFMFGIILSVIAFAIVVFLFPTHRI